MLVDAQAGQPLGRRGMGGVVKRPGRRIVRQRRLVQVIVHASFARDVRPLGRQEVEPDRINGQRVLRRQQAARPLAVERRRLHPLRDRVAWMHA